VEDEWVGVPGHHAANLTANRLEPLVEVMERFKELLFTGKVWMAVLAVVEQVIPCLGRWHEDGSGAQEKISIIPSRYFPTQMFHRNPESETNVCIEPRPPRDPVSPKVIHRS